MNKININGLTQGCTAEQLNAIAWNILHRKGDVDMSSCNVTITPPSGMSPGMAGIIVKCATDGDGVQHVKINGATEYTDDEWEELKEYGTLAWIKDSEYSKYEIPYLFMLDNMLHGLPRIAASATNIKEKTWFMKYPVSSYESLVNCKYSVYKEWETGVLDNQTSGWSGSQIIGSMYFVPSTMPTQYKWSVDDNIYGVYINGTKVLSMNGSGTSTFDFSKYINLNKVNVLSVVAHDISAGYWVRFGFVD